MISHDRTGPYASLFSSDRRTTRGSIECQTCSLLNQVHFFADRRMMRRQVPRTSQVDARELTRRSCDLLQACFFSSLVPIIIFLCIRPVLFSWKSIALDFAFCRRRTSIYNQSLMDSSSRSNHTSRPRLIPPMAKIDEIDESLEPTRADDGKTTSQMRERALCLHGPSGSDRRAFNDKR